MGYEVWTTRETYICGETFRTKEELMGRIKTCEQDIENCKARLKTLVFMTEPKKFYKEDDVMFYVERDFEEIMEELEDNLVTLTRLWKFEEAWDKTHDSEGRSILPVNPLDLKNRKDYMGGDCMKYILEDGSEMPEDWWDVYNGFIKPEDCSFADKLGYPLKPQEPERNMTIGELNAIMKLELEKNDVAVNIDEF